MSGETKYYRKVKINHLLHIEYSINLCGKINGTINMNTQLKENKKRSHLIRIN